MLCNTTIDVLDTKELGDKVDDTAVEEAGINEDESDEACGLVPLLLLCDTTADVLEGNILEDVDCTAVEDTARLEDDCDDDCWLLLLCAGALEESVDVVSPVVAATEELD